MRVWMLVAASVLASSGCMTTQLRHKVAEQASSLPDTYYQEVLDNLAMIVADPGRMPYFSDPQTSRVQITQTASANYTLNWDLITVAPTGVLTLFNRYLLNEQSATLGGAQANLGEYASLTANDPDKLFSMRAAYRRTAGTATSEDDEMLNEFYYRHFEVSDRSLARLHENRPDVFQAIGTKLAKLSGVEYLTVESFEKRLAESDILGPDELGRYRRPILKYTRMDHEPTEFVSDADTHHLLYLGALKPGWYCVGQKRDVPKHARYVGHYGDIYLWVPPENVETLTRLTLAILDIHTFKSERIGGPRIQPALQPRY